MSVGKVNKFGRALEYRLGYTDAADFKAFSELNINAEDVNDLLGKKDTIDGLVAVKDDIDALVGVKADILDLAGDKTNILISQEVAGTVTVGTTSDAAVKIVLNGNTYYIPLYTSLTA